MFVGIVVAAGHSIVVSEVVAALDDRRNRE